MFDFFDMKVVLNTPSAAERMQRTVNELRRVGITDFIRFEALPDETPHRSFNRSVNGILNLFAKSDKKHLLMLEDDVVFNGFELDLNKLLGQAINELPDNWDMLYLGANLHVDGFQEPIRFSNHLCRIYNAWTTHAIAFNHKCVKWLAYNQPQFHEGMFDGWLSSQLFHFNAFCITPMIAFQRPGKSNIWGHDVDYEPVFRISSDKLVNLK
jgi:hypothetical protein